MTTIIVITSICTLIIGYFMGYGKAFLDQSRWSDEAHEEALQAQREAVKQFDRTNKELKERVAKLHVVKKV